MRIKKPQAKNKEVETDELLGSLPDGWTIAKLDNGRTLFVE